jgi:hypothetical protein
MAGFLNSAPRRLKVARFVKTYTKQADAFISWDTLGGLSTEATHAQNLREKMTIAECKLFKSINPDASREINGIKYEHQS